MSAPTTLQDLLDRSAIADVCVRYATALDGRDWELLATCFTDDVVTEYGGGRQEGFSAFERTTRRWLTPAVASQHQISNVVVDLDGDTARSRCLVRADHVHEDLPGRNLVFVGRYHDTLARTDAGWRIAQRRFDIWWTQGDPDVLGYRPRSRDPEAGA